LNDLAGQARPIDMDAMVMSLHTTETTVWIQLGNLELDTPAAGGRDASRSRRLLSNTAATEMKHTSVFVASMLVAHSLAKAGCVQMSNSTVRACRALCWKAQTSKS